MDKVYNTPWIRSKRDPDLKININYLQAIVKNDNFHTPVLLSPRVGII